MNILFDAYETVIGFECHVQLSTASKLFSKGANRYGAPPNSLVDVIDAGLPGVLPVINQRAVEFAIKLGLATGCVINRTSIFARKHYFYPDLPKGYQISQFDKPICENGQLNFMVDDTPRSIRIRRIHIEEDAGKNTHAEGINASYVDFNRAGTPLLEVVTEPDLRDPKDAIEAFKALRKLVMFLNICDGNMQEGSIRADVNVSVRKVGDNKLGTRTETKNLNSFRFLGQAISFESRRQIIEIESGKSIRQETRQWDPNARESYSMRSKEEAHDYRYFPDPDLLPLFLPEEMISHMKKELPELPHLKYLRYRDQFGLNHHDAQMLTSDRCLAEYFEEAVRSHDNPKAIANWIINEAMRSNKESEIEEGTEDISLKVPASAIAGLVKLIDDKIISSNIGKKVLALLEKVPTRTPKEIVEENSWQIVSDQKQINDLVLQVIKDHHDEVEKYLNGKTKVFGFLMGQLMKRAHGKIDPAAANQLMLDGLAQLASSKKTNN